MGVGAYGIGGTFERDQLSAPQSGGWTDTVKRIMFMFWSCGAWDKSKMYFCLPHAFYASEIWLKRAQKSFLINR